jgi:phage tail-like protein
MAESDLNPLRLDPYKNFKFRVKWDGKYVAGISKISALKRTTEVVEHREGGDLSIQRKSPGLTRFDPIILERGVTQDTEFEDWANLIWKLAGNPETSIANFRKDIVIDFFDEADRKVLSYIVHRCWVSEYQALPELDTNSNAVAIQHIKLENEGWERDLAVVAPAETR